MKKENLFVAVLTAFFFSATLPAQTLTPGYETDWHFYKNRSLGKAPDEFQRAVIPDVSTQSLRYPVIRSGDVEVASLEIQPNASLTLAGTARLAAETVENMGTCEGCEGRLLSKSEAHEASCAQN